MPRTGRAKSRSPRAAPVSEAPPRVVVLAAGIGSRMRSTLPKVLHRVAGRTLLDTVLDTAEAVSPSRVIVVLGSGRERVEASLAGRAVEIVVQDPPLGTGDAVRSALPKLENGGGPVLVLSGDVPLLRAETLAQLLEARRRGRLDLALLSFRPPEPGDFGRVVRNRSGAIQRIVESKNANAREKRVGEVNAGVYCFAAEALSRAIGKIARDPISREYYLTDAVEVLASAGGRIGVVEPADWREAWGVNTRRDLAAAEEIERRRSLERALDSGATVIDPATTRIGPRVVVEPDVTIHPFVCLEGNTRLAEGCEVLPFTRLVDTQVGPDATVGPHCEVERSTIGPRARVGPFARLRPESVLEEDVKVGNFVELKKTTLRRGTKASHLSYLGDAEIGPHANIGAGVITCNYDGEKKFRTSIGEGVFVGSDAQLVAPVTVGRGAYVAAGTTVTEDVPDGALAISRVPQKNVEGWVDRRRERRKLE